MKNLPIDEEAFREKMRQILKRPKYGGLYTFAVDPLIDNIVQAVKECESEEAVAEEEAATIPELRTTPSLLEEAEGE